ncbi:MAG: hypothetical protein RIS29_288 [Bacteroidota bacterium]|jgi:mono/diheme cytochrome c family protein
MKAKYLIYGSLFILMGCSTTKKTAIVNVPEVKLTAEITQGKEIYDNKCGKCHKLFAPAEFSRKRWPGIVDNMQRKAKITDEQKALVVAYVSAYSN